MFGLKGRLAKLFGPRAFYQCQAQHFLLFHISSIVVCYIVLVVVFAFAHASAGYYFLYNSLLPVHEVKEGKTEGNHLVLLYFDTLRYLHLRERGL